MMEMKHSPDIESLNHIFIAGPLTLNRYNNLAHITPDTRMQLSPDEFETLSILAAHEDITLTFEQLYNAVWDRGDSADKRDEARECITNIVKQVNTAGNGFVWIDSNPSSGYIFQTKWAHNLEKWRQSEIM